MDPLDYCFMRSLRVTGSESLSYNRHVGDWSSRSICFLPWQTSLRNARRMKWPLHRMLATYELPAATVCPSPERSAKAIDLLVTDAVNLVSQAVERPEQLNVIGFSLGTAPATMVANRLGARLCSVTSADRGDLMLWQSPAVASIKREAQTNGFGLADFGDALAGKNPVENLRNLRSDSVFVWADRDQYVPTARRTALLESVRRTLPKAQILRSAYGHIRTNLKAARLLNDLLPE